MEPLKKVSEIFALASLVSGYVSSLEMVLMEEAGTLDDYTPEMTREEYSPIFANMNSEERKSYETLGAEITAVSQISLAGSDAPDLSDTFRLHVASAGIRMQELFVSVAVRSGLMDEADMIEQWPTVPASSNDAEQLEQHDAPLLSHLAREAALRPATIPSRSL